MISLFICATVLGVSKSTLILNIDSTTVITYQTATPASVDESSSTTTRSSVLTDTTYDTTSNYLLGLSAYGGLNNFGSGQTYAQLQRQDNIEVIGFGSYLSSVMPSDNSQRDSCCSTPDGLKELINSGEACSNYGKYNYGYQAWSSNRWLNKSLDNGH